MMGSGSVPRSPEQGPTQVRRTVDAGRTRRGTEALRRVRNADALRARNAELTAQLRAAALEGDEAHITRLLSELLHVQGLTRGQRISLQLTALLNLVHTLRSTALTDELTGLHNPHGILACGAPLLDEAMPVIQPRELVRQRRTAPRSE